MKYAYFLLLSFHADGLPVRTGKSRRSQDHELEKQLEDAPKAEKAQEVLETYQDYINRFPEDRKPRPLFVPGSALQYRMNRFSERGRSLRSPSRILQFLQYPKSVIFLGTSTRTSWATKKRHYHLSGTYSGFPGFGGSESSS